MTNTALPITRTEATGFLAGGGDMGARMRAHDWTKTPLGPPETWPQSLKTAVRIMLTSRQPIWIGWGRELTYLYNEPYKSIIGGKHPWALGKPTKEVWQEIWHEIGPQLATAMGGIEGTYVEEKFLVMERHGYPEETYYTYSYTPIPDDQGGAGGIICANTDDTQRVIGERQLALLRELAAQTADARTWQEACKRSARALETNPRDLPFALLYVVNRDGRTLSLAGTSAIAQENEAAPATASLDGAALWPFATVLRDRGVMLVSDLADLSLPAGAWDRAPDRAAVVFIAPSGQTGRAGVLIAGLNPFRQFDHSYRAFLGLVAGQIGAAVANAEAYEAERQRAEALAEIDRAKTAFFSNVSHEFRTPLTLMLGPLEDLMSHWGRSSAVVPLGDYQQLDLAHRNGLRLLKLVNTLLDFSRIEAGRVQATYEETDLAALTADLASVFRSATEKAGLRLVVDCPPLAEPAFVDREMWEKIVLNLVSNAFKYTFEGEIEIKLRQTGKHFELAVRDTGIGIPEDQIPKVFERFHRVAGAQGRTHEGSGIGLALVRELVRLHSGSVSVESVYGKGTTFRVFIPAGKGHLPHKQIGAPRTQVSTATGAQPFVNEALRWLPDQPQDEHIIADVPLGAENERFEGQRPRVLLADDNADMRGYVARLLSARYEVEAVADGATALEAARTRPPDLIISDVMMPRLDGFGLLKALRVDERTQALPIVLLSARAGEEARIEGLGAGADDYLVKPFSAKELLARVATNLDLARMRKDAARAVADSEGRFRAFVTASSDVVYRMSPDWSEMRELDGRGFLSDTASPTEGWRDRYIHPDDLPVVNAAIAEAIRKKKLFQLEHRVRSLDGSLKWTLSRAVPILDECGEIVEWLGTASDATARKRSEERTLGQRRVLEMVASGAPLAETLDELLLFIETLEPGMRCGLLILAEDGSHFRGGSNPSLVAYSEALHQAGRDRDAPIAPPYLGACAEAAHEGAVVLIPDVAAETRYAPEWRNLLLSFGFRACRSTPVRGLDGRVLASLAMHYDRPRDPTPADPQIVDLATHLAAIAIERDRSDKLLRESQECLQQALAGANMGVWRANLATGLGTRDGNLNRILGLEPVQSTQAIDDCFRLVHPDDKRAAIAAWRQALETEGTYQTEFRIVRDDRVIRWLKEDGKFIRGLNGAPDVMTGTTQDITQRKRSEEALRESEERLNVALEAGKLGAFDIHVATSAMACTDQCKAIFGCAPGETLSYDDVARSIEPEDLATANAAIAASIAATGEYHEEYRCVWPDGSLHWIETRGRAVERPDGAHVIGVNRDVTEVKLAAERQRLLTNELNHRVKNTLAVIQAIAAQTARFSPEPEAFQEAFSSRVQALARVHDVLTKAQWSGTTLGEVAASSVAPFNGGDGAAIRIAGPLVHLDVNSAISLSLALNELATNAAKYGALKNENGHVTLEWSTAGPSRRLQLVWMEQGGPPVTQPTRIGFGTRLIERLAAQLGAKVTCDYRREGCRCDIILPADIGSSSH